MTPVISPWVFYIISIVDGLKMTVTLGIACAIVVIVTVGAFAFYEFQCEEEVTDKCKKLIKIAKHFTVALAVFIMFCIFIPDSNTITKMIVAQNVTYERVEVAANTVQEVYKDFMEVFGEEIK